MLMVKLKIRLKAKEFVEFRLTSFEQHFTAAVSKPRPKMQTTKQCFDYRKLLLVFYWCCYYYFFFLSILS